MIGLHHIYQFGQLTLLDQLHHALAHGFYLIHIDSTETQESANIDFFHLIALIQATISLL